MLRVEAELDLRAASVLVFRDLEDARFRRILLAGGPGHQEDDVRVLLQLTALAQIVHRDLDLFALFRRRDLAQAHDRDAQLLRHAVQAHGDRRDLLVSFLALDVDQLHVIDEDHLEAPLQGPRSDMFQRRRLPDHPQRDRLAGQSDLRGLSEVFIRQFLLLGGRDRDPGQLVFGHEPVLQRLLRRLQAEEADALACLGDVHRELQREGRLAGRAVGAEDHEHARRHRQGAVEPVDPEVQVVRRRRIVHPVQIHPDHLRQAVVFDVLRHLQQLPDLLVGCLRVLCLRRRGDGQCLLLHGCESGLIAHDLDVLRRVGGRRRIVRAVEECLDVLLTGLGAQRDGIDRLSGSPELPRSLEQMPQRRVPEHRRRDLLEDLPRVLFRRGQQRPDDGILRPLPDRVHSHSTSSSSSELPSGSS